MILATSFILKILLVVAVLILGYSSIRKKMKKKTLAGLAGLVLIFSIISNYMMGLVPSLTDTVTLTAMGEGRENSQSTEVFLKGYSVDGIESLALEDLQITDGHWFWNGNSYCWRPESDHRQPDGITRSIELQMPVGWNRTLNFKSSEYRGKVQIETLENKWVIDTYSEEAGEITEQIGRSATSVLILNEVIHLGVYTLLFSVLLGITCVFVRHSLRIEGKIKELTKIRRGKFIYASIALIAMIYMFYNGSNTSLWFDELLQIGFTNGSLAESIQHCIKMDDVSPPLFSLFATFWYRVIPYGEQWLLLLPMTFAVMTIYVMGLIGEELQNTHTGILASIFAAFSTTIWIYAAYEYRPYSLLVFSSSLTFYYYIRRNRTNILSKWDWRFVLSMTMLSLSHYFGMLVSVGYFIWEIVQVQIKKLDKKIMLPYLLPGGVGAIWLGLVFINTLQYKSAESIASWYPVPEISHIQNLLKFLSGNIEILFWALLLGMSAIIVSFIYKKSINKQEIPHQFSVWITLFVCAGIWAYGNFINNESTMWQNRYFLVLIPYIIITSIFPLNLIESKLIKRKYDFINSIICVFFGVLLFLNCLTVIPSSTAEPYRQSADWIYTQGNYIFNDDTLILCTSDKNLVEGWSEYYIERRGRRDPLNTMTQYEFTEDSLENYDRIYLNYNHTAISSSLQKLLNEYYTLEQTNSDIKVSVYVRKE